MEMLDMENTITEIKTAYMETQESRETISEDKDKPIQMSKTEARREKIIMIKIEECLPELWDNIKPSNIHEIGK